MWNDWHHHQSISSGTLPPRSYGQSPPSPVSSGAFESIQGTPNTAITANSPEDARVPKRPGSESRPSSVEETVWIWCVGTSHSLPQLNLNSYEEEWKTNRRSHCQIQATLLSPELRVLAPWNLVCKYFILLLLRLHDWISTDKEKIREQLQNFETTTPFENPGVLAPLDCQILQHNSVSSIFQSNLYQIS